MSEYYTYLIFNQLFASFYDQYWIREDMNHFGYVLLH